MFLVSLSIFLLCNFSLVNCKTLLLLLIWFGSAPTIFFKKKTKKTHLWKMRCHRWGDHKKIVWKMKSRSMPPYPKKNKKRNRTCLAFPVPRLRSLLILFGLGLRSVNIFISLDVLLLALFCQNKISSSPYLCKTGVYVSLKESTKILKLLKKKEILYFDWGS